MEETLRAFLDASVLYPVSLRHLLMRLALASLYQAQWSARVHDERIRSLAWISPSDAQNTVHGTDVCQFRPWYMCDAGRFVLLVFQSIRQLRTVNHMMRLCAIAEGIEAPKNA